MKQFKYLFTALLFATSFVACNDSDPVDPGNKPDPNNPAGQLPKTLAEMIGYFGEKFGLNVKYEFSEIEWKPVTAGEVYDYTAATDTAKVKQLLTALHSQVFSLFPEGVISQYMPAKILIVDSLYQTFTFEDAVAEPPVNWSERHTLPGNVTGDYLVIANAGARLDTAAADFKYNLISLVVERMLFNQNLPEPAELKVVTERVADERQLVLYLNVVGTPVVNGPNYPYWDGRPESSTTTWLTALDLGEDPLGPIVRTKWNGLSILNMGRKGFYGSSRRVYFGIELRSVYYSKGTLKQDFADFAALIFTKTPAQREAFFAAVEANKECSRQDPDPSSPYIAEDGRDLRTPYGDTEGANGMREKVGLVKAYFKNNLGFELPE